MTDAAGSVQVSDIRFGSDGSVYVAGSTLREGFGADVVVARYSAAGEREWAELFGSNTADSARTLSIDRDGNVLVIGGSDGTLPRELASSTGPGYVARFRPNGEHVSTLRVGSPVAAVDGAGHVYVAVERPASVGAPPMLVTETVLQKLDPAGSQLWAGTLTSPGGLDDSDYEMSPAALAIGPAGTEIYVASAVMPAECDRQCWGVGALGRFDQEGGLAWSRSPTGRGGVFGYTIDGLVPASPQPGFLLRSSWLALYDAEGLEAWAAFEEGDLYPEAIAVDAAGDIIVAGRDAMPGWTVRRLRRSDGTAY
jgi:hypothetical protein